jgi:hypothetical protein
MCGLLMRLPVQALNLAPSAEIARHMTETILPDSGFSAGTANRQRVKVRTPVRILA